MAGKYFDDLAVGQRISHNLGRTVTEMDNVLFSALTMNTQPLHINEDFAAKTQFGQRIVNGLFTLGLAVGLTVADLTEGTIVANLGYDQLAMPKPVFIGDTIKVKVTIGEKREHKKPGLGIVPELLEVTNQRGEVVLACEHLLLVKRKA